MDATAASTAVVVLLRGVNLGPHRRVSATDLRAAADDAGLGSPRTYANSGNLVALAAPDDAGADVSARVTAALARITGTPVPAVSMTADELAAVAEACPFPEAARDDPAHLQLHVGGGPLDEEGVARLADQHPGPERFAVVRGVLVVHYVAGIGRSRLTTARIDRAAGTWTTARNWRTTGRLLAMAHDLAEEPAAGDDA